VKSLFFEYPTIENRKLFIKESIIWVVLAIIIGGLIGSVSTLFLMSLDWVTQTREDNVMVIWLLPLAGMLIIWLYQLSGKFLDKGNNLLISEYHQPKTVISWLLTPLIFVTTLITHLFGGSAGREGTAMQMGSSIADQFSFLFKDKALHRKTLIICGISAGFGSLFGTPITGIVFGFEVLILIKIPIISLLPAVLSTYTAFYISTTLNAPHTHYDAVLYNQSNPLDIIWFILAGLLFGGASYLFVSMQLFFKDLIKKLNQSPYLIIAVGGVLVSIFAHFMGTKYIGLGIPIIADSFDMMLPVYDFLLKILLTTFTLAIGFKGGEVTPLFFIGATLGNALFIFGMPLPLEVLAAVGFVAVLAGATNTPLACSVMGIELFGMELGVFFVLTCYIAYLVSGKNSVYEAQQLPPSKAKLYKKLKRI
jgi:H+/Cl- antiporter ClcA